MGHSLWGNGLSCNGVRIDMTLTTQPQNVQWSIVAIVMVSIGLAFLPALFTIFRAMKSSYFQRSLELPIGRKFLFVCFSIFLTLRIVFLTVFASPSRDKLRGLISILFAPLNMIIRKVLLIGFSPFFALALPLRRIIVTLGNLCSRKCHELNSTPRRHVVAIRLTEETI